MKVLNIALRLLIVLVLFSSTIFSQLELSTYTDKDIYDYGETINLFCKITNTADTTFEFFAPTYQSCQAEFSFNDFNSWEYAACLTLTELLTFEPHASKTYSWKIEPKSFGLPNKNGTQTIIVRYFFDLADTIYIQAPLFLGGEIMLAYQLNNIDSVAIIRESLNADVLSGGVYGEIKDEVWQIEGYDIDSLIQIYSNDSIFISFEKSIRIMYEKIVDENPLDYYPLQIGNKWYYDVKYIPGWSTNEINYALTREVIKDTILSNDKLYFQIRELRSDTNMVKLYYERIDSVNGKVYQFSEFITNNEFIQFDLIANINIPFITIIEFDGQQTVELMYLTDQGQEDIFNSQLTNIGYRNYTANSDNNIYGVSHKLNENIGRTYFTKHYIDGFDEYHYLKAAYINGVIYGDTTLVGVSHKVEKGIPTQFFLSQNYPNPFNPTTTIEYTIPVVTARPAAAGSLQTRIVKLIVYDVLGREIATLVNENQKPGNYEVEFDGANLSSGIYFYRLATESFSQINKMLLLK